MGLSVRRGLQIMLLSAAWLYAPSALAQEEGIPADPEALSQTNALVDGGFQKSMIGDGTDWLMERSAGTDGTQPGAMYLNDGIPGAISAIHQSLTQLTPGNVYTLVIQWRGVGHEIAHSTVAQVGLTVEFDGIPAYQLTPAGRLPTDWTTNELPFTVSNESMLLTLRTVSKSAESGIQINYVDFRPLEEGLPTTVGDIVVTEPDIGEPIELTDNGLVVPPLPDPIFADGEQEPERAAEKMPSSTRLMAYSINNEVRGKTDTEDYFFDVDADGLGKIILGQGLNFDVVGVDEVMSGEDLQAFASAAMAMSGVDLTSDDVVMLRASNGAAAGSFLSVFDGSAEFSPQFSPDNVFIVRPPLETEASEGFVSLEAAFWPGEFIRHQGFFLKLDPVTADSPTLDKRDATFQLVEVSAPATQQPAQAPAPQQPAAPTETVASFEECVKLLTDGNTLDWGGGKIWNEPNAARLCEGVDSVEDIMSRFSCFEENLDAGREWKRSIDNCTENVQTANAEQPAPQQPAQVTEQQQPAVESDSFDAFPECVKMLTDGGTLNWGEGTFWDAPNAERLCVGVESVEDIMSRFSCFTEDLVATRNWDVSVDNCTGNVQTANAEQPAPQQPAQVTEPQQPAVEPEPEGNPATDALGFCLQTLDSFAAELLGSPTPEGDGDRLCGGINSVEEAGAKLICVGDVWRSTGNWEQAIAFCSGEPQAEPEPQYTASAVSMDQLSADGGVFYGEVGGIPVAIGSDQIGIEYDPKFVALKVIKGDSLSSTIQIVFSSPVSGVEVDLGDYDVSDGTNPVVAGRSAEYMSNFSVFPSETTGSLVVVDGGEVHSKDNDGAGTLVWRDLQGVQVITFVHHRGLPGLGVFIKGLRVTP